jgi:hypothetical protein
MIDQTTLGTRFITETFGQSAAPRVTWQIDVRSAASKGRKTNELHA